MSLNANIPLSVDAPKIDSPLTTIGGLMQLRGQIQENALRSAQIAKETQQTADLKQANDLNLRNQGDAMTFQKSLASNGGNWQATFDQLAKQGSLLPANLSKFQKDHFDAVEAASKSDAQTLTTNNAKLQSVGSAVAGIQQLEPAARPAAWQATVQRLRSDPQLADIAAHLPDTWDDKAAEQMAWGGVAAKDINDAALKLQDQRNKDAQAAREVVAATDLHNKSVAELPGIQADAAVKGIISADTLANPKHLNPEQAAQDASREATQAETKSNDAARIAVEQANAKTSQGQLSVAQAKESREHNIFDATYGNGVPDAVKGLPPVQARAATKEAQKIGDEYLKSQEVADNLQAMIDAARKGNKAAGSNLPLVGVEALNAINGIKRINSAEIAQYQGAGSLLDSIQGKIGKLVSGQPIPEDVMKDIESLHKTLRENGEKSANDRLGGVNHNYGSAFTLPKSSNGAPVKVGTKVERDALPKGTRYIGPDGNIATR